MTDLDWLDAIEARLAAAGPNAMNWQWRPFGGDPDCFCRVVDYSDFDVTLSWDVVADEIEKPEHAEFIAHAPADIARLMSALREAQAKVERVEALAADFEGGQYNIFCRLIRAALADPKETE